MSHRFWVGLALLVLGLVLITICWVLRKRDDSLYVETEITDAAHLRLVDDETERGAA